MSWLISVLATCAVGYGVVVAAAYFGQRALMYFPAPSLTTPGAAGAPEMQVVMLQIADGHDLASWYARPSQADCPVILYLHGNGGSIAGRVHKVRPFLEAGHGLLLLSYRGYGGNPGRPSERGLYADGRAALEFLNANGISLERIVVLGESLGSGVAVRLAAERVLAALILEAPFTSATDVGQRSYPFLPVRVLLKDRYDSLSRIGAISVPLLVVHGQRDRTVPVDLGRRLFDAAPKPKEGVFPAAAGHNDLFEHGATDIELAFVRRVVEGARDCPGP